MSASSETPRPLRPGVVSVVTVVDPGAGTVPCLDALAALTWPADRLELVVVGDGLTEPPAVAPLRARGMEIHLVDRGDAASTPAAFGRGAGVARGEYLAFLDPRVRPAPDFLDAVNATMEADIRVSAVAPKVVDDDDRIVFVDAALSFAGRPRYPHAGLAASAVRDVEADVLFSSPLALFVQTRAFRFAGGFDDRFCAGVELVDLGWRLWLAGFTLRYQPAAVVRCDAAVAAAESAPADSTTGSLGMIFKNYDDESLRRAFAPAMLLAGHGGSAPLDGLAAASPDLVAARHATQSTRVRDDYELRSLFRDALAADPADADEVARLRATFGIDGIFGIRRRIAIVTPDTLRAKMAGPAIRAWQMAIALSREHDVRLATTVGCELTHPDFPVSHVDDRALRELDAWCDVLVFQGHVMKNHPWLRRSNKILVVDIYDPMHLEVLEQARELHPVDRRLSVRATVEVLNEQLARGDFFLCASEKQRDFWLGQLAACGRINPATYDGGENLQSLITVVPFGVSDEPPRHTEAALRGVVDGIGPDDKVIMWGGGVYNWFDPLTLLRAVDKLRTRMPEVRLFFLGLQHPNPTVPTMRMATETRKLAEQLGLVGTHVFFNEGWVDYDKRQNYLLESDIGVSTHLDHIETTFSFRTRILDYLWASLPIVATDGDSFADTIADRGLGLTVPAGDVDGLEEALFRLLDDAELHARCREAIERVVPEFRWSRVLEPLLAFCRNPARAPDLLDFYQRMMLGDPIAQAMWGSRGWRHDLRIAVDHARHGEYRELVRKIASRADRWRGAQQ